MSVSGLIGFVGIIVPHTVRLVAGHSYRVMLPLSILFGAAFLTLTDLVARTAIAPAEMPIGVVTAFFGAPFFIVILRRTRGGVGVSVGIVAKDVTVELGGRTVLDHLDLSVEPGDWVSVVGPNGSGKTTLLRVVGGSPGRRGPGRDRRTRRWPSCAAGSGPGSWRSSRRRRWCRPA